ncbi:uncharacterized protein LOC144910800 isoform X2 [Branchiostoma floridae x Branchiostoma belcheri]
MTTGATTTTQATTTGATTTTQAMTTGVTTTTQATTTGATTTTQATTTGATTTTEETTMGATTTTEETTTGATTTTQATTTGATTTTQATTTGATTTTEETTMGATTTTEETTTGATTTTQATTTGATTTIQATTTGGATTTEEMTTADLPCYWQENRDIFGNCFPVDCDRGIYNQSDQCGDGVCCATGDKIQCCDDINECETNNGGCEHNCTNTIGSFECSCMDNFLLANDDLACNAAVCHWEGGPGFLGVCITGDCVTGTFVRSDRCGDGDCCSVGEYIYCCEVITMETTTSPPTPVPPCYWQENRDIFGNCFPVDCDRGIYNQSDQCGDGVCCATGDKIQCCDDINECETNNGGCEQICTNTIGSFECSCRENFVLANDSLSCNADLPCYWQENRDIFGNCFPVDCDRGIYNQSDQCGDGVCCATGDKIQCCDDINECETNNGGCEQICTNTIGSFECSCRENFVLANDSLSCNADLPCYWQENRDIFGNCFPVDCDRGIYNQSDQCGDGVCCATGDKIQCCDDINECETNNGGCEHNCTNTIGSFECSCMDNFLLANDDLACNGHTLDDTEPASKVDGTRKRRGERCFPVSCLRVLTARQR